MSKSERLAAIKKTVDSYHKASKKEGIPDEDFIMHFGIQDYPRVPSGIIALDRLLGDGFPGGKVITIAGAEQTGKGTIAARTVGHEQKRGGNGLWIDAEEALDKEWMAIQGVDPDELLIVEKDTMENMLDQALEFLRKKLVTVLVIDSIGALLPRAEQETKTGTSRSMVDDTIGMLQRKMGQFLRMACGPAAKSHCPIIMLGQVYTDINSYGALEMVKGGNAVKHFTHVRLMTRRGPKAEAPMIKEDGKDKLIGFQSYIKLGKTRQTGTKHEGSEASCPFLFGKGFDDAGYLVAHAIANGKVGQSGAWLTVGEQRFQGKSALLDAVRTNEELFIQLLQA